MQNSLQLHEEQLRVIHSPINTKVFLEGLPGTGKTTAANHRLLNLVSSGVDPASILILVPQQTLGRPYQTLLDQVVLPAGSIPYITTLAGLGQRVIRLFWPLLTGKAGFMKDDPPFFLSIETSQYYLHKIVQPLIDSGLFESVTLDRNRLLSQILDNLNKSAFVGFPSTEISDRLKSAWIGDVSQQHIYQDSQTAANQFREFCLANNLVDFSLTIKIFCEIASDLPECRSYLNSQYRHLIYDNTEEDTPSAHDFVENWLPDLDSALLIKDTGSGYRTFLGADPLSAMRFKALSNIRVETKTSYYGDGSMTLMAESFKDAVNRRKVDLRSGKLVGRMEFSNQPYPPEMVRWVSEKVEDLVQNEGVPPGEIVVVAPFLSDSVRFSLTHALKQRSIPSHSHRPSRRLSAEPPTLCMLTLAQLAHPQWKQTPTRFEIRNAFMQSFAGIDLVRADLMSRIVYSAGKNGFSLHPFSIIQPAMQERITFRVGEKFEILRSWLESYQSSDPVDLDIFLSQLFGEILSQPGFGFHQNYQGAATAARLIGSAANFRNLPTLPEKHDANELAREFLLLFQEGIIGTQFRIRESEWNHEAVFIAPAYTFLMLNQPVRYQFWLDVSSMGWWERINQPLTHPAVLSRHWITGNQWTDVEEYSLNQMTLQRIVSGLLYRCTDKVFLCAAGINQGGDEERGPLLQAIQHINLALIHESPGPK